MLKFGVMVTVYVLLKIIKHLESIFIVYLLHKLLCDYCTNFYNNKPQHRVSKWERKKLQLKK
jgi:hypothetical protein